VPEACRAIKINPNVTAAWANRAAEYEYAEVWDKAISDYDQRIALQPETAANAHLHRGFCKLQQDKSIAGLSGGVGTRHH
jgi:tetratricopeptide (TPR) repeat protein